MVNNSKSVSIIIVHWNTPDNLKNLLRKLHSSKDFEIIVIDNNSDKSVDWINKSYPSVNLIHNSVNRGYAFACNQGILASKGDWLLFVNPDVEIASNAVKQLVHFATTRQLDAVSPDPISNSYKKPLTSPLTLILEFTSLNKIFTQSFISKVSRSSTLFGGALCIRRNVITELGGWDERFFIWFEDSDLTKRLLSNNYRIGWAPVNFKHEGGASFESIDSQTKRDMFFNSMSTFGDKHFEFWGKLIIKMLRKKIGVTTFIPELQKGVSITVPNMRKGLLDLFLKTNRGKMIDIDHLIIVTSASSPDKIWRYRKNFPSVRFIPIEYNNGFAHTVNIGFRASPTTWVGTVNDDVILSKRWIHTCINSAPADTGSLNPVVYKGDDSVESSGIDIHKKGKAYPMTKFQFLKSSQFLKSICFDDD